jgi:hypothetical protein
VRHLRWDPPERRAAGSGRNPYLQAAAINGVLAVVVVLLSLVTGGSVVRAIVAVAIAWSAGTAYTWWRIRQRAAARDD